MGVVKSALLPNPLRTIETIPTKPNAINRLTYNTIRIPTTLGSSRKTFQKEHQVA
ncbi:MAG: hypothetical protein KDC71_16910 [Acidobacteria bacterium]|nr:hypothetical protein [Acidobacteriota bacterium]